MMISHLGKKWNALLRTNKLLNSFETKAKWQSLFYITSLGCASTNQITITGTIIKLTSNNLTQYSDQKGKTGTVLWNAFLP